MLKFLEAWLGGKRRGGASEPGAPDEDALAAFMQASQDCALLMSRVADHLLSRLPEVSMPEDLLARTRQLCVAFAQAGPEVMQALSELDEIVVRGAEPRVLLRCAERIVDRAEEDVSAADGLVRELRARSEVDESHAGASILVTEAVARVLRAVVEVMDARAALGR